MTEYKAGDEVTVRGWVKHDTDSSFSIDVRFDSYETGLFLHEQEIVTHTPKPRELKVGDAVGLEGAPENFRWKVLAIHDEWAWLVSENAGAYCSARKTQIVQR